MIYDAIIETKKSLKITKSILEWLGRIIFLVVLGFWFFSDLDDSNI